MDYIFPLTLIGGVALLVCFLIVGYYMYANVQRKDSLTNIFAQKENEILELYSSLERMMEELERFVYQSKLELQEEKAKILELYGKMPIAYEESYQNNEFKSAQINIQNDKLSNEKLSFNDTMKTVEFIEPEPKEPVQIEMTEKDRLMQKVANKRDSKGGKVITLYRQGVSVQNIAKMMSMGHGEVQLLIDLKNKYN